MPMNSKSVNINEIQLLKGILILMNFFPIVMHNYLCTFDVMNYRY